jgi:hypothetical protein
MNLHGWIGILLLLGGCSRPPDEASLRARLRGSYCSETIRLTLGDSVYVEERYLPGALGTYLTRESCRGRYRLRQEGGDWWIRFEADPAPRAVFETCASEFPVWTRAGGFGGDSLSLPSLFTGQLLPRAACEPFPQIPQHRSSSSL